VALLTWFTYPVLGLFEKKYANFTGVFGFNYVLAHFKGILKALRKRDKNRK